MLSGKYRASIAVTAMIMATWSMPAFADQYPVFGPKVEAFAASNAHQGPNVHGSQIDVVNGAVVYSAEDPNGGLATSSPLTPGYGPVSVQTHQYGGFGSNALYSEAGATTDMTTGTMRAYVGADGPNTFGSPLGFATSKIMDTVYFNNTSGGALILNVSLTFDGQITVPVDVTNQGGSVALQLSGCGACSNSLGQYISFASNPSHAAGDWVRAYFNEGGIYSVNDYGNPLAEGQSADFFWSRLTGDGANGVVNGIISTSLIIPTGVTSLGIGLDLQLDCRGGSTCDFGHTSLFSFDALPEGLSFTSESGKFLTNVAGPTPGVPEPASWAMLLAGMFGTGAMLRRRPSLQFA